MAKQGDGVLKGILANRELMKMMPEFMKPFMDKAVFMAKGTAGIIGKGAKHAKIVKESIKDVAINKFPYLNKLGFFSIKKLLNSTALDALAFSASIAIANKKYLQTDQFIEKLKEELETHQKIIDEMKDKTNKAFPELLNDINKQYELDKMEINNNRKLTIKEKNVKLKELEEVHMILKYEFWEVFTELYDRLVQKMTMNEKINEKLPAVSDNPSLQRFLNVMSPVAAAIGVALLSKTKICNSLTPTLAKMLREKSVELIQTTAKNVGLVASVIALKIVTDQTIQKKEINEIISGLKSKVDKNESKEKNYDNWWEMAAQLTTDELVTVVEVVTESSPLIMAAGLVTQTVIEEQIEEAFGTVKGN